MTKEEAIEIITNTMFIGSSADDIDTAINMAIQALEQEPFMNKPCVAHQVCHEDKVKVLDKIRAEIIDMGAYEQEVNGKTEFLKGIDYCLSVIDKYTNK